MATIVARNVLEWRLDPSSDHRDPVLARRDRRLILICQEGYQSSLAAATQQRFGLDATDVIGGFQAWREAELPVAPTADETRSPMPEEGLEPRHADYDAREEGSSEAGEA